MSYAAKFEDELGGLDINELPAEAVELQEEARQEKKSQGGYRFNSAADRAHIKAQRGAIWAWVRGLGGNLIKHGVNLTKVPLPVELCEPRSFLERLTDSWAYLDLLHAAAAATDPVERLKLVVAFAVGGMRQQVSCDKPFNPILGETLQGVYTCGCEVCAEQISHHPPISCWQIRDHAGRFEYSGSSCWSASFQGNSVKGTQSGESRVKFASDGATITWSLPSIHIRGVLFGERVVKYHDTLTFRDGLNGLECVLQIEPQAPKRGLVRKVLHKARHPRGKGAPHDQLLGELMRLAPPGKKGETVLDTCGGTWLTDLTWDKGVRSTILPESFDPASAAAAAAAAAASAAAAGEDAGSVVCHSIGSFSTTSGSTISDADAADTAAAAAAEGGQGPAAAGAAAPNGISSDSSSSHHHHRKHHSSSSGGSGLTAAALAAHASTASQQPQQQQQQQQQQDWQPLPPRPPAAAAAAAAVPGVLACNGSAANLSSSDAAGHRSGKGISVVKQLWAPNISTVYKLRRLAGSDPKLLPSDTRYRPDVMALAGGANQAAQRWKQVLEQKQRADRQLRGHAAASHGGAAGSSSGGAQHHRQSSRGSEQMGGDDVIIRS